jgi:hypothetical protein
MHTPMFISMFIVLMNVYNHSYAAYLGQHIIMLTQVLYITAQPLNCPRPVVGKGAKAQAGAIWEQSLKKLVM